MKWIRKLRRWWPIIAAASMVLNFAFAAERQKDLQNINGKLDRLLELKIQHQSQTH
jgi:hypothetical protein